MIDHKVDYPEDIKILREKCNLCGGLTDEEVDALYSEFSQTQYSAGWIAGPDIEGFKAWMNKGLKDLLDNLED